MTEQLWIHKSDGTITEIGEIDGCRLMSVVYGSPQPSTNYVSFQSMDGNLDMGTVFGSRTITAKFFAKAKDTYDLELLYSRIHQFIYDRNAYYIRHSKMPGKRWLVKPEAYGGRTKINRLDSTFEIEFTAFKGYAESAQSTLNPFTFSNGGWQTGQGLLGDDFQYIFNANKFRVYNPGDFDIDPREHYLVITIDALSGGDLRIANSTTNDQFIYYPELKKGKPLTIEGHYPMFQGMNCGRDTNHGLISLAKGWNDIVINNASQIEISFDFYPLYH